uniref:Uncharacterized protein ycf23 n=1 Tax=Rhodochaete parvula TaxID=110510 RepID=A0A220T0Q1_9RHOD|nr:hypothetical protein Rhodc_142 [Rhodochaete parvula]
MTMHKKIVNDFRKQQVLKIISGINNFNENEIYKTVRAATLGEATYIDIAADLKVISLARKLTNLPICVSSIIPQQINTCVDNGVDIIEIGNFDAYYSQSMSFTMEDIKNISRKVRQNHPSITICTTLPYILSLKEQLELAKYLEFIGINLLQTEGTINSYHTHKHVNLSLNNCHSTLLTTYNLSKIVNIPIISASGISINNAKVAMSYGASGLGIKTAISKIKNIDDKVKMIKSIKSIMSSNIQLDRIPLHID